MTPQDGADSMTLDILLNNVMGVADHRPLAFAHEYASQLIRAANVHPVLSIAAVLHLLEFKVWLFGKLVMPVFYGIDNNFVDWKHGDFHWFHIVFVPNCLVLTLHEFIIQLRYVLIPFHFCLLVRVKRTKSTTVPQCAPLSAGMVPELPVGSRWVSTV